MSNILNLPTEETMKEISRSLGVLSETKTPQDHTGSPGSKHLLAGNKTAGFYGFVQAEEFGIIEGNPEVSQAMSGANLALAIGLTQGTVINNKTAWMKFSRNGEVFFVPVKPIRHSMPWNAIYNQGAVYGNATVGVNPPNGRAGKMVSVNGSSNSFVVDLGAEDNGWLREGAVTAKVGDTIVSRGFVNAANNGEFTVQAITNTEIFVNGTLVTETGTRTGSIYEKSKGIIQNKTITIGGRQYQVQLLKGSAQDPLDSFADADRDMVGPASDWNNLVLPLHEKSKLGNWAYPTHAGTVPDWSVGLSDADLVTHHTVGAGSYTWCQETSDTVPYRRVLRGHNGASHGDRLYSWYVSSSYGWRPALRLLS